MGLTSQGRINWEAPVIKKNGIHTLPYFLVLDEGGSITAQGDDAKKSVLSWMPSGR